MVAKAGCGGGGVAVFCGGETAPAPNHPDPALYEPWEMTERERYLTTKCLRLIQGDFNTSLLQNSNKTI